MDKNYIISILNKNNYWEKWIADVWYIRNDYIEKIEKLFWVTDLIKVLIWQRRSWKSYIIRQLIYNILKNKKTPRENILYLNMELDDFLFIKNKDILSEVLNVYLKNIAKKWRIYLFIDEIQNIDWWEKYINSLRIDDNLDIEIIITWSNSKLLSWELVTYIAWRYFPITVYPFSFQEYLWIKNQEKWKKSFINYLSTWWIPELYRLPDAEFQKEYIQSLRNTIILKDIAQRYNIKDIDVFEKVFLFFIWNIWNLSSLNSIYKKMKSEWINISIATISNYIRYLQEIFIFHWVSRYDLKWKKILEWEKKYYLNDLSFLNYSFSNYDSNIGKKLENYVFSYLIQKWYNVYVWNFWDKEIDFVAERDNDKIYIQVAYLLYDESVVQREYWNLKDIRDSFPKYVITMDDLQNTTDSYWIIHKQAWNLDL